MRIFASVAALLSAGVAITIGGTFAQDAPIAPVPINREDQVVSQGSFIIKYSDIPAISGGDKQSVQESHRQFEQYLRDNNIEYKDGFVFDGEVFAGRSIYLSRPDDIRLIASFPQ
ncbi:hypothetical protein HK102_002120, partial [Quaeritorhiza haematococci]